jgi:hypothetical protein
MAPAQTPVFAPVLIKSAEFPGTPEFDDDIFIFTAPKALG